MNANDYPLTIEILTDSPCDADLKKGQICKAKYISKTNSDLNVFDPDEPEYPWLITKEEAKVVE